MKTLQLDERGWAALVNYQAERILIPLAKRDLTAVWDYFGARLATDAAQGDLGDDEERFEAVPFQFHGLEKELSKNTQLAISKGLSWFAKDSRLFQFRGGKLLSNVFPSCTAEFATALAELVKTGGDMETDFALAIVQNYHGQNSTHVVLKEVVARFPTDAHQLNEVKASIESTGVVSGEFGLAEAWEAKKQSLANWLTDNRPAVRAFAERHISELDLMVALEKRRAETRREMRKRDYEDDDNDKSAD